MSRNHELSSGPKTVHWGYFDATIPPVLTVQSGDRVTLSTVNGGPDVMPPPPYTPLPELLEIHAKSKPDLGPHIVTGPVAVEGAEPGDTLEVRIEEIRLREDWGYNIIKPGLGTLPDDFPTNRVRHIAIDRSAMTADFAGRTIPLKPFFGTMGVAPARSRGRLSSVPPDSHGGNIDNKELVAGTTLFLPVWAPGALFSAGDGHAVQGDGEVCLSALETALTGTFQLILHKKRAIPLPRAETDTHIIAMGFDHDLDEAARQALRELIAMTVERTGLTPEEAYVLASLAGDLHVTQLVDENKGIHAMLAKSLL